MIVDALLDLQEIDLKRLELEKALAGLPEDIAIVKRRAEALKLEEKQRATDLKSLELKRKEVDGEVQSLDTKIIELKTKQAQVKKTEEYEALVAEIVHAQGRMSDLETEEIELLLQVDSIAAQNKEKTVVFESDLKTTDAQVVDLEGQIERLQKELVSMQEEYEHCRSQVTQVGLDSYDMVAKKGKKPFVVKLEGGKCMGCHLKVSAGTEQAIRLEKEFTRCENCGRILYIEG